MSTTKKTAEKTIRQQPTKTPELVIDLRDKATLDRAESPFGVNAVTVLLIDEKDGKTRRVVANLTLFKSSTFLKKAPTFVLEITNQSESKSPRKRAAARPWCEVCPECLTHKCDKHGLPE